MLGKVLCCKQEHDSSSHAKTQAQMDGHYKGHGAWPNVLVAHLQEGIEAVQLDTGRTLCKLHLPSPGLHADLNADGLMDHIQVMPPHRKLLHMEM